MSLCKYLIGDPHDVMSKYNRVRKVLWRSAAFFYGNLEKKLLRRSND